jgi:hypothetical protein
LDQQGKEERKEVCPSMDMRARKATIGIRYMAIHESTATIGIRYAHPCMNNESENGIRCARAEPSSMGLEQGKQQLEIRYVESSLPIYLSIYLSMDQKERKASNNWKSGM